MTDGDDDSNELEVPDEVTADNVISFRPISDAATFPRVKRHSSKRRGCQHGSFLVDEHERTVECGKCHEVIDPVLVILMICRDWEWIYAEAKAAEAEAARLNAVVEERKKARAKVSRAREARADCIEVEADFLKKWRDDNAGEVDVARLGSTVLARLDAGATMLLIEVKKKEKA